MIHRRRQNLVNLEGKVIWTLQKPLLHDASPHGHDTIRNGGLRARFNWLNNPRRVAYPDKQSTVLAADVQRTHEVDSRGFVEVATRFGKCPRVKLPVTIEKEGILSPHGLKTGESCSVRPTI